MGYTDAAWRSDINTAGSGWIIFDKNNIEILHGSKSEFFVSSSLMAEAMAARSILLHAQATGISRICIKSDCQALLTAISSRLHPADIYGIILDIETLSSTFAYVVFMFIPRAQNLAADSLAKSALYLCNSTPTA